MFKPKPRRPVFSQRGSFDKNERKNDHKNQIHLHPLCTVTRLNEKLVGKIDGKRSNNRKCVIVSFLYITLAEW